MFHTTIKSQQCGFTLLEVLIAFIILSVGILGIINLQSMSKKFTHQSIQRSLAVIFADIIIERIRINPSALVTYTSSNMVGNNTLGKQPTVNCYNASCNATQLALSDMWKWEQALAGATVTAAGINTSGLISPKACLVFTPTTGKQRTGILSVQVQWTGLDRLSDAITKADTNCNASTFKADPFRRQVVINTYLLDETES